MRTDIGIWAVDPTTLAGSKLRVTDRVETERDVGGRTRGEPGHADNWRTRTPPHLWSLQSPSRTSQPALSLPNSRSIFGAVLKI